MASSGSLWGQLVRDRTWCAWAMATILARLPSSMTGFSLLYLGKDAYGSITDGALLAGAFATSGAAGALWRAKAIDRGEVGQGLRREAIFVVAAFSALAAIGLFSLPLWIAMAVAAAAGACASGMTAAFRTLVGLFTSRHPSQAVFTADAFLMEVAFVSGPVLAGLMVHAVGPIFALLGMACAVLISALMTRALPCYEAERGNHAKAPWRVQTVIIMYVLAVLWTVSIGLMQATTPAKVEEFGGQALLAGLVLASFSLGSAAGGLVLGRSDKKRRSPAWRASVLLFLFGISLFPAAVASEVWLLGLALFAAGLPVTRINVVATTTIAKLVSPQRRTEGFALYSAALGAGGGLGNLGAGTFLPSHSPSMLLIYAAALPIITAVTLGVSSFTGSGWLRRLNNRRSERAPDCT